MLQYTPTHTLTHTHTPLTHPSHSSCASESEREKKEATVNVMQVKHTLTTIHSLALSCLSTPSPRGHSPPVPSPFCNTCSTRQTAKILQIQNAKCAFNSCIYVNPSKLFYLPQSQEAKCPEKLEKLHVIWIERERPWMCFSQLSLTLCYPSPTALLFVHMHNLLVLLSIVAIFRLMTRFSFSFSLLLFSFCQFSPRLVVDLLVSLKI